MKKQYDLCWLPSSPLQGIKSYCLQDAAAGEIAPALHHEMHCSFGAVHIDEEDADLTFNPEKSMDKEAYRLSKENGKYTIAAQGGAGFLYGLYALIRRLKSGKAASDFVLADQPVNKLRMINHWDMLSGEIERGYAGRSIFYEQSQFIAEDEKIEDYARLLASVGINGISMNNVNVKIADIDLIYPSGLTQVKRYCDILHRYGIKPFFCVNFASPVIRKELDTANPCDPTVQQWWNKKTAEIYQQIPYFGGFLIKADSEGEPGPYTYGRNHAQGANMFAKALAPHGGIAIWRCFVYNCQQDWRDRSIDRAKAAYEVFKPLDGQFDDNVILQVKFGPIDFQIREPVSPLIGALSNTNLIVEFQITQEYTGQQKHICYLPTQWQEVLQFNTHAAENGSTVRELIGNKQNHGIAAVGSVGRDANWTGHKLAQANWYGFGRMAWNPALTADVVLEEWISLTFSLPEAQQKTLFDLMLHSREVYEAYTVPLGVGFMCKPGHHYGPDIDGYEYDRWGTYHFADRNGIGNNRTQKDGTGYTGLYREPKASLYEDLNTCPDEVLLFFHHVPYTHKLKSGKTVIQHIYDSHFAGCAAVKRYIQQWETFSCKISQEDYENVRERLAEQYRCAKEWRDQVNTYFWRKSGIPDQQGRAIYP